MESDEQQISKLKQQIINQIDSIYPEDKKEYAIKKIKDMNDNEFLEFLKNNNLIKSQQENSESEDSYENEENSTPFRLIANKKIPSYIIEENKFAIAVLEINPISNAHIIVIPKKAIFDVKNIPKQVNSLANKISKKIFSKFKPKNVIITPSLILKEIIINIIPVYSNETSDSPRKKASEQELNEIKNMFQEKINSIKQKKPTNKKTEETKIIIPRRIP